MTRPGPHSGPLAATRAAPGGRSAPVLAALIAATCLPELVVLAADLGLVGSRSWRAVAYSYGGFWAGLLRDWQANYPGQAALMFVTYAFLHGGPGHLAGNMLTLASLGPAVAGWLGTRRFLLVYAAGMLGGAALFGLLSAAAQPMVGASGAIFGLAGALVARDWLERRSPARTFGAIGALAALNLAMWALMGGGVAWQTHLGGALAGGGAALALRRPR
jgi:rhomboid protease GluP